MNPPLPSEVVLTLAKRPFRMHNYVWHELRNNWLKYPKDTQQRIADLGWEPPRPSRDAAEQETLIANGSGEDYLFLHRQAIAFVNRMLAQIGDPTYSRIQGWVQFPLPGDPDFPVPSPFWTPAIHPAILRYAAATKTDLIFERFFKTWEALYTDPMFLRSISLAELGSRIHWTVHSAARWRWASTPNGVRPDPSLTDPQVIPPAWDDPRNDFLADTYSMQLNPVFWKIYGWIDDRVEDWKLANAVFGFDFWQFTWIGKIPEGPEGAGGLYDRLNDPALAEPHVKTMEEVLKILAALPQ